MFNTVLETIGTGVGTVAQFLADFAAKASTAPGILGDAYKPLATTFQGIADTAKSMAIGFKEQGDKAYDAAVTTTVAFDAAEGALGKARDTMVAASEAQVQLGTNAPPAADGVRKIGDAAGYTEQELKAMEDATRRGQEALFDMTASGQDAVARLQTEITAQTLTGVDARLFAIQQAQTVELQGYQDLALNAPALYEQITTMIEEKYAQQAAAAQGFYSSAAAYAESAGFTTRDQMEQNVATTLAGYMQMVQSGEFSAGELKKAWTKYITAKDEMEGRSKDLALERFDMIASAAA